MSQMSQQKRPATTEEPVTPPGSGSIKRMQFPSLLPASVSDVWRITTDFDFVVYLMKPWFTISYDRSKAGHNLESDWTMQTDWKLFGVIPYGRWGERIVEWEPEKRFVDVITNSPFKMWRHTHLYESRGDQTLYIDSVEIDPGWMGPLGPLVIKLLWIPRRRKLIKYFERRAARGRS